MHAQACSNTYNVVHTDITCYRYCMFYITGTVCFTSCTLGMKQVTRSPRHTINSDSHTICGLVQSKGPLMNTCTCYSQMCTHVHAQAFSPHLSVVNREMAHVYSVQCTQCIHRNAVYVMLQNSDNAYASRDHSDILRNVLHI